MSIRCRHCWRAAHTWNRRCPDCHGPWPQLRDWMFWLPMALLGGGATAGLLYLIV
jgi:hypothetical protein